MRWIVTFHPDCKIWFDTLDKELQDTILTYTEILTQCGPNLGRPWVDSIQGSDVSNLKELRVQHQGAPWRILFAFDPLRQAILLTGGNKQSDKRWYKTHIPIAETRFNAYLETLKP